MDTIKIIDLGTVIDVNDPKGLGRIRYTSYDTAISAMQSVYKGEPWAKKDPFVALPFLPPHINIIPNLTSAVKIIRHIAGSEGLSNVEYIPGPYTSPHDYYDQQFSDQVIYTTYGVPSDEKPDIKSFSTAKQAFEDNFIESKSVGTMARYGDVAFNGNYGSDILLTESGVQLRAGKFQSKLTNSTAISNKLKTYPYSGKSEAKLSLKKFPFRAELVTEISEIVDVASKDLAYLIEYDLNDFTTPTGVTINVYQITTPEGGLYKSNRFSLSTMISTGSSKLILSDEIEINSIEEAYMEVRNFVSEIDTKKMNSVYSTLPADYAHPFYFRPTNDLLQKPARNIAEQTNKNTFLSNIKVLNRQTHGLFFSRDYPDAIPFKRKVSTQHVRNKDIVLDHNGKKIREDYVEESIGSLITDKFYLLSRINNGIDSSIDFYNLTKYELDQIDYNQRIDPITYVDGKEIRPNTFSMVRGEKLIELLELMVDMLLNHSHGIVTSPYWPEEFTKRIFELKSAMRQDMVNRSLRIN